ncbi:MAG: 4-(cytidine 5'-diphospho)-2-C-methyl-D-erythritol kinase [Nitrospirae bacterium]|nr:4-(cytidine 5'-diphospho)-2-C-methyl-D-erythritol kinase [Nitrospirota bacterium]
MKTVTLKIKAPAKVNFVLEVVGRRPDGYHDLVSVMQALELADELTLTRTGSGVEVRCDHPEVPVGPGNIAYRAAEAVLREGGFSGGVSIHIKKVIPVAAGLGGGSSDAAAAMKGVAMLYGLEIPRGRMADIALGLGADVPFFLSWPCALAQGVGERLTELPPTEETWIVLVKPPFGVSTAWVYSQLNLGLTNTYNSITLPPFEGRPLNAGTLVSCLRNDLERVTVSKYPLIKEIKERLLETGAVAAMMSGSGPTVFGVYRDRAGAEASARSLDGAGWAVHVTRTILAWPEPERAPG